MLAKDIGSNYFVQACSVISNLLFIPVLIHIMGVEAYGFVAIYTFIQAWIFILDAGLTPSLSRAMTHYLSGEITLRNISNLIKTIEVTFAFFSFIMCLATYWFNNLLLSFILNNDALKHEAVGLTMFLIVLLSCTRLFETIYRSALLGLEKTFSYNKINLFFVIFRMLLSYFFLCFEPSVNYFFAAQIIATCLSILFYANATYNTLAAKFLFGSFSLKAIREVKGYAGGLFLIMLLTLVVTQIDRIILTKNVSMLDISYYGIAMTLSGSIILLTTPVTQVLLPRMTSYVANNSKELLLKLYRLSTQINTAIACSCGIVLLFFAKECVFLWTNNLELSNKVEHIVRILSLGFIFNSIYYFPVAFQLAHGYTKISVYLGIFFLLFVVPLYFYFIPVYGIVSAAYISMMIQFINVTIGSLITYKIKLNKFFIKWWLYDIIIPISSVFIFIAMLKETIALDTDNRMILGLEVALLALLGILVSIATSKILRKEVVLRWNYLYRAIVNKYC